MYVVLSIISARKNGVFHFNYSMEQDKIYISSPIDNEKVILNNHVRDVLRFKLNITNGRSPGSNNGMKCGIFVDCLPGFSLESCIFLYASFVETSVGDS